MKTGEKISKQRKLLNYTQEQLAELVGVSRQSVSKWESGLAYPETDKLIKLGKLFNCSIDYLLNDEISETAEPQPVRSESVFDELQYFMKKLVVEKKSERLIFGMPLYHIGRDAKGFFAVGLRAKGIFALGLYANGIVSVGLLSIGLISVGLLSAGLLALGCLAIGICRTDIR